MRKLRLHYITSLLNSKAWILNIQFDSKDQIFILKAIIEGAKPIEIETRLLYRMFIGLGVPWQAGKKTKTRLERGSERERDEGYGKIGYKPRATKFSPGGPRHSNEVQ